MEQGTLTLAIISGCVALCCVVLDLYNYRLIFVLSFTSKVESNVIFSFFLEKSKTENLILFFTVHRYSL